MSPSGNGAAVRALPESDVAQNVVESGDSPQIDELYHQYSRRLVRQLSRSTGCRETASDLMHETFVRLMRLTPGKLAVIERPEAWLNCVSKNLFRRWHRTQKVAEKSKAALEIANDPNLDQIAVLETRETLRRVEAAMAQLSRKTRTIFVAHRIEGMSYAEIAEARGISVRTVEWHIGEAIVKLDRMLNRN